MAEDSRSTRKHKETNAPVDRSDTFLFKFARNLGQTARAIRDGSTWLFENPCSVTDKKEATDVTKEEAATGVTADVEAAVKAAAKEPYEEEAAAGISADVEAAVKAAGEDIEEDEVPADVEAVVKAVEKATEK